LFDDIVGEPGAGGVSVDHERGKLADASVSRVPNGGIIVATDEAPDSADVDLETRLSRQVLCTLPGRAGP